MSRPDEAEFKEWLGHPVTEWVMGVMVRHAERQKQKWADLAWHGNLDPLLHREAHVRADCYRALVECTYEDWITDDSDD